MCDYCVRRVAVDPPDRDDGPYSHVIARPQPGRVIDGSTGQALFDRMNADLIRAQRRYRGSHPRPHRPVPPGLEGIMVHQEGSERVTLGALSTPPPRGRDQRAHR